jgi:hypothetical protein
MRRRLFEQGGIIEGYGIEFCFTTNSDDDECGGVPLVLFSHALMLTSNYDDVDNNDNNYIGDVVVVLLTMIKHSSTVQAAFAAKAKQSHWAVMFSTCSYVGG